jgi:hypothetical protein
MTQEAHTIQVLQAIIKTNKIKNMAKCRFILMNKGVCESDFICDVEKPLIDESITMEFDNEFKTYEVTFVQHTFKKNGEFKYIMVTGIRKN